MDIYSLFMFVAVMLSIIIPNKTINKDKFQDRSKKYYCLILGLLLFFIAALRATSVGVDSMQYTNHFYRVQFMSVVDILHNYTKEPVFYFLIKIITVFSTNHQWMFAIIGGAYAFAISRFIYKYFKNLMVSFIMLIPMMYFAL